MGRFANVRQRQSLALSAGSERHFDGRLRLAVTGLPHGDNLILRQPPGPVRNRGRCH